MRKPPLAPPPLAPDADSSMPELAAALGALPRRAYAVDLPPRRHLAHLRTVQALAGVLAQAVLEGAPATGAYIVAGVGMGGVVAHEVAAQLQLAGAQVRVRRVPGGVGGSLPVTASRTPVHSVCRPQCYLTACPRPNPPKRRCQCC